MSSELVETQFLEQCLVTAGLCIRGYFNMWDFDNSCYVWGNIETLANKVLLKCLLLQPHHQYHLNNNLRSDDIDEVRYLKVLGWPHMSQT